MDATTMRSIISLVTKLQSDHPQFHFRDEGDFRWDPLTQTIFYDSAAPGDQASLLHELGHALLGHAAYQRDLELLQMERDAWGLTMSTLADTYNLNVNEEEAEEALDTYRDWLHARSTCPKCTQTGLQPRKNAYKCVACGTHWRVNEARRCGLKRHILT